MRIALVQRVTGNIHSVVDQLTAMQKALCAENPDLVCGAGASGLFGGL